MKKIFVLLFALFVHVAFADTVNLQWLAADNTTFQNSTCTTGGDLNVPSTTPTKYGYDFVGWRARAARELEYVTFQDTTSIDTGIKFDSDSIEYETKLAWRYNGAYYVAFGGEGTCSGTTTIASDSPGSIKVAGNPGAPQFVIGTRTIGNFTGMNGTVNTYKLYVDKTSRSVIVTLDETQRTSSLAGTPATDKNILIGNLIGTVGNCDFKDGRMYYFKITKDGVLVRDMIPVLDADGVACFYDRVTKTFFYSTGMLFVAGPLKE